MVSVHSYTIKHSRLIYLLALEELEEAVDPHERPPLGLAVLHYIIRILLHDYNMLLLYVYMCTIYIYIYIYIYQ